jgi:TPR repeat protein
MVKAAVAKAEQLEAEENWPEALRAYVEIARQYPDFQSGKVQLEMLVERLRVRPAEVNAAELKELRPAIEEAAELNVLAAMMFLGENLRRAEPEESFRWFSTAAERGNLSALTQVGLMYSNGRGVEADLNKAIESFQAAAEKGHGPAKTALAECYLIGKNVPKDEKKAMELLHEAVEIGDPRAMDLLGTCYHDGVGGQQNFKESFRLYSQAAELGYLDALGNLGVLYLNGDGVKRDPKKAAELILKGVNGGSATCMYFYARLHETGPACP